MQSVVSMPTVMVMFVMAIPYVDNAREGAGVWFTSDRGKKITKMTAIYTAIVMPAYIYLDSTFPLREILRGTLWAAGSYNVLPEKVSWPRAGAARLLAALARKARRPRVDLRSKGI